MTEKQHTFFLIIASLVLWGAGSGLTFFNNFDFENLTASIIAVFLMLGFSFAEWQLVWSHFAYKDLRDRARKFFLGFTMFTLLVSMSVAFGTELYFCFQKMKNKTQASTVRSLMNDSLAYAQSGRERNKAQATATSEAAKLVIETPATIPFVLCYGFAGLNLLTILFTAQHKLRKNRGGNKLAEIPKLREIAATKYFGRDVTAAYEDNKGNGYSLKNSNGHVGFITNKELSQ